MNASRIQLAMTWASSRALARAFLCVVVIVSMQLVPALPATAATTATVCLFDSGGTGIAGADAFYRSGGWQSMGPTEADGCVSTDSPDAAGRIRFRISHGGQRQQITQDTRVDPLVVFQTVAVTVRLVDSGGVDGISGATVTYRASGWQPMGTTDATGSVTAELLPANTRFRLSYGGQTQQITQDTSVDPLVVFQTVSVTVRLVDSGGVDGIEGATVTYSAGSWQPMGTTDATGSVTAELLPANTRFRLSYGGLNQDITQDTSVDPVVSYQTGQVLQGTGLRIASYRASGWIPFTEGVEMLPGSVRFRFEDGSRAYHTIVAGPANYVPTAPTAPVVTAADASSNEGDDFALSVDFVDQEPTQTHTATIDWGDGSPLEAATVVQADGLAGNVTATHLYADDAVHSVQVCVTDDGNPDAQGCTTFDLTVANVAPTAQITGVPASATEGSEVALSATVNDPGSADVIAYLWSATADGEVIATSAEEGFSFTPPQNGDYQVSLTIDDGDGGVAAQQIDLPVANVAPTVEITGVPTSVTEGTEVVLGSTVTDPGSADVIAYLWSVSSNGELVSSGSEAAFSFTPQNGGDYQVSLTVDDGDGGLASRQIEVMVEALPPPAPVEPAQPAPAPVVEEPVPVAPAPPVPAPVARVETDEPASPTVSPGIWELLAPELVTPPALITGVEVPERPEPLVPVPEPAELPEPAGLEVVAPQTAAEDEGSQVPWLLIAAVAVALTFAGALVLRLRARTREAELLAQLEATGGAQPTVTVVLEEQVLVRSGDSAQN